MIRHLSALIAAAALCGLGACATAHGGQDFDASKSSGIKTGTTTVDQVQALLGPPVQRSKEGTREAWVYYQNTVTSGTAGGAARTVGVSAVGAIATMATGLPFIGMFMSVADTASGGGPMGNALNTTQSSKTLVIIFNNGVVSDCKLTMVTGRHAGDPSGPMSDTETSSCGG